MRSIVLYGIALGIALILLTVFQYNLIIIRHLESVYTGMVALVCCIVGIWAGRTLSRKYQHKPTESQHPALNSESPRSITKSPAPETVLSPRELEVLSLICRGHSNQEIADALYLSLNTVKTHISNLFVKLDVQRRTQAIQKAKSLGLVDSH